MDWDKIRSHKFTPEPTPSDWPKTVRGLSLDGLSLFGVDETNRVFWDGRQIVVRGRTSLAWPERALASVGVVAALLSAVPPFVTWVHAIYLHGGLP